MNNRLVRIAYFRIFVQSRLNVKKGKSKTYFSPFIFNPLHFCVSAVQTPFKFKPAEIPIP